MQPSLAKINSRSTIIDARERLIVALDVSDIEKARQTVKDIGDTVLFYKIGLQLQLAQGVLGFVEELVTQGKKVFLDYKYFDIENTVEQAVSKVASIGVSFLTVHGNGSIIKAAVKGRGGRDLKILSVTVLTSLDAFDIKDLGFDCSVEQLVLHRAQKAVEAGCDGVIASGLEIQQIRNLVGEGLLIVAPGIRPGGSNLDDHKRSVSPTNAILAGADYLVLGRPILGEPNPKAAAEQILSEMQSAFDQRINS